MQQATNKVYRLYAKTHKRHRKVSVKQKKRREENKVDHCQSLFTITNHRTGVDGFLSNYEVILSSTDVADKHFLTWQSSTFSYFLINVCPSVQTLYKHTSILNTKTNMLYWYCHTCHTYSKSSSSKSVNGSHFSKLYWKKSVVHKGFRNGTLGRRFEDQRCGPIQRRRFCSSLLLHLLHTALLLLLLIIKHLLHNLLQLLTAVHRHLADRQMDRYTRH